MSVLLSNDGSRASQKHQIPKEASVGSGTASKSKKDNSVNVYPPGPGRASPNLATPIRKGEQSIAGNENTYELQDNTNTDSK